MKTSSLLVALFALGALAEARAEQIALPIEPPTRQLPPVCSDEVAIFANNKLSETSTGVVSIYLESKTQLDAINAAAVKAELQAKSECAKAYKDGTGRIEETHLTLGRKYAGADAVTIAGNITFCCQLNYKKVDESVTPPSTKKTAKKKKKRSKRAKKRK